MMLRMYAISVQIWFQLRVKDFSLAYAALGSKASEMEKNIYSCFYFAFKAAFPSLSWYKRFFL